MGQFSFDGETQGEPPWRAANRQGAVSGRKGQRDGALPELTGDPATDQVLLELAEILAEIARTARCASTDAKEEE